MNFAQRRKGLSRLGARIRDGQEARIVAFGGSLTFDGYYLAATMRTLATAYPSALLDFASRALPGFASELGVFRTRSVVDLSPDLVIVEFSINDAESPSRRIVQAVEGIVRQLRANDPDRDLAFVYFAHLHALAEGKMTRVIAEWERVADHYGIPSFDCIVLAEEFVKAGTAMWFEHWPGRRSWDEHNRPIALTRDGGHHTALGGSMFGASVGQSMVTMFQPTTLTTASELPPPLDPGHWQSATFLHAGMLACDGWIAGPLSEDMSTRTAASYFDRLLAAERAGAKLKIPFVGRHLTIWTIGTGGTLAVAVDGKWLALAPNADRGHHSYNLLSEEESGPHVFEAEVRTPPIVIAGLDIVGQVLPQTASNG